MRKIASIRRTANYDPKMGYDRSDQDWCKVVFKSCRLKLCAFQARFFKGQSRSFNREY